MKRLIVLALVAVLVIVMSAPAALSAMGGKKVTICHNGHTIKVSKKAWKNAHKPIHHDKKGPCNGNGNHHGNGNGGKDDDEDCDNKFDEGWLCPDTDNNGVCDPCDVGTVCRGMPICANGAGSSTSRRY